MHALINTGIGVSYASKSQFFLLMRLFFFLCASYLELLIFKYRYAAYIFCGYKSDLTWECNAVIKYTNPCKGCSRCYSKELAYNQSTNLNRRWWHAFLPKRQTFASGKKQLFFRFKILNHFCM